MDKKFRPQTTLDTEVTYLKGVGPALAQRLRPLNIERVRDLLFHLPSRYEDRRHLVRLDQLADGAEVLVRGKVLHAEVRYAGRRSLRVLIDDGSASALLRFFHFNEQQKTSFAEGRWVQAYGTARGGAKGYELIHPEYRVADQPDAFSVEAGLTPIYPLATGVTQARLRTLAGTALDLAQRDAAFNTPLHGLDAPDTLAALRALHHPQSGDEAARLLALKHPAQLRLIREELLAHQLCMRLLRSQVKQRPAPALPDVARAAQELLGALPFRYTRAQQRVLDDIAADLAQRRPMLRLVQGDVGSGKTVVAAAAMLAAARAGRQSALMAPTELLAEQHHRNFTRWLQPLGLPVELLAGKLKKGERE
ncbi:MAG TPA: DEAD/DEAH box helicase, partial [Nevskiaceae bacterium]|nr:DEAD/DEAH box helicase [Nevskiaceae bacterium]